MKDWQAIIERMRNELKSWFVRQCKDTFTRHYLYYMPTTAEHDGGLLILSDSPPNPDYLLAHPDNIRRDLTVEQNLQLLIPTLRQLPILSA